jgi:hypothetical protein
MQDAGCRMQDSAPDSLGAKSRVEGLNNCLSLLVGCSVLLHRVNRAL